MAPKINPQKCFLRKYFFAGKGGGRDSAKTVSPMLTILRFQDVAKGDKHTKEGDNLALATTFQQRGNFVWRDVNINNRRAIGTDGLQLSAPSHRIRNR